MNTAKATQCVQYILFAMALCPCGMVLQNFIFMFYYLFSILDGNIMQGPERPCAEWHKEHQGTL